MPGLFRAGVGERPLADHAEVAVNQQKSEIVRIAAVGFDVHRILALADAEELEFLFEIGVGGFGVAGVEEPPVFGFSAQGFGIVGEFLRIVVFRVHRDADNLEVRVIPELIVDRAELLAVADGALRADREELGGDPDLAAQVRELDRLSVLIGGG